MHIWIRVVSKTFLEYLTLACLMGALHVWFQTSPIREKAIFCKNVAAKRNGAAILVWSSSPLAFLLFLFKDMNMAYNGYTIRFVDGCSSAEDPTMEVMWTKILEPMKKSIFDELLGLS